MCMFLLFLREISWVHSRRLNLGAHPLPCSPRVILRSITSPDVDQHPGHIGLGLRLHTIGGH